MLLLSGCVHVLLRLLFGASPEYHVGEGVDTSIVDLGYARYTGIVNETTGVKHFVGIRYAEAPTGPLRWRAPRQPAPIPGIQVADTQPPGCYNTMVGLSPIYPVGQETLKRVRPLLDLILNPKTFAGNSVYAPASEHDDLLPVMFWIHGGGYIGGSSSLYYGDHLIQEAGGRLVVVSIQYRLGVFGFLSGKAVKQGGDLNAGLLDQQLALTWVHEHIKKFGGDPAKVTIAGSSAGAGSVMQHVIAHDGNTNPPLFRAAMISSSYLPPQYTYDHYVPEGVYNDVLAHTGCSSSSNTIECLRTTDAALLQTANKNAVTAFIVGSSLQFSMTFGPVVDGTFITQRPTEAFKKRKLNGKMLLAIIDSHEGNIFVNPSLTDIYTFISEVFPTFGQREIGEVAAQYSAFGSTLDQAIAILSEAIFVCPTYYMLRAFPRKSYKAEYAIPPALHDSGLWFYFPPGPKSHLPYHNKAFVDAFSQAFTSFVIALNPNVKTDPTNITPHWDRWNGKSEMLFNRTEGGLPDIREFDTSLPLLTRCAFWESLSAISQQ
ncbi:hypothetical protein M378DRAFT_11449 [Amanita muscaria Koide BX008]|uniref:Carboxylic ester hydrolase n=1 Tax=Amanita muscaria (strain Koide BX008) TaxID=946122 RepID=A0A0C2X6R4_AMAMK|nr:hypothetical protein M378DRAFT_11449 [Amanita muscaria Koide BX008]